MFWLDNVAAEHGQVESIQWLINNSYVVNFYNVTEIAIKNGHLNILRRFKTTRPSAVVSCHLAANSSQLEVLDYLYEESGSTIGIIQWLTDNRVSVASMLLNNNHAKVIEWLNGHGFQT